MKPPSNYKDIQKLTGCLVALSRFISEFGEQNLPFLKNLRKTSTKKFHKDEECDKAFEDLKQYLRSPQLLSRSKEGEGLQMYLAVAEGTIRVYCKGAAAGIMIQGPDEVKMEYALRFSFKATNNEAEYAAMIAGFMLVKSLGVQRVIVRGDRSCKWVETALLKKTKLDNIVHFLWKHIITRFGIPRVLVSDNGPQFEGSVLAEFCEKYGIERRFSPVYYHQANGQVEVMNHIIFNELKKNTVQTEANKGA
ncbi:hypothetical protein LIER_16755 [Lithospermum erythrorhizon]|uniref:Integrase catalytic domain-containing protein n=1 Tax=Lithospermum erythrorhizon TaxID=34254 RepID=A0AAV3Q7V3_LITER